MPRDDNPDRWDSVPNGAGRKKHSRNGSTSAQTNNAGHTKDDRSKGTQLVPCKFFRQGTCTAGRSCQFAHIRNDDPSLSVCKFYQKGNCKFGNRCALAHIPANGDMSRRNADHIAQSSSPISSPDAPFFQGPSSSSSSPAYAETPPNSFSNQPYMSSSYHNGMPRSASDTFRPEPSASTVHSTSIGLNGQARAPSRSRPGSGFAMEQYSSSRSKTSSPRRIPADQSLEDARYGHISPQSWSLTQSSPGSPFALSSSFDERHAAFAITRNDSLGPSSGSFDDRERLFSNTNEEDDIDLHLLPSSLNELLISERKSQPTEASRMHRASYTEEHNSHYDPAFFFDDDDMPFPSDSADSVYYDRNPRAVAGRQQGWISFADIAKSGLSNEDLQASRTSTTVHPRAVEPLCPFALHGNCRYGDHCRYLHGLPCPHCNKRVLHPYRPEEHAAHIQECTEKQQKKRAEAVASNKEYIDSSEIECGICFEKVLSKPDARFGLLSCEHAFCLSCIRTWRANTSLDAQVTHSCPLCRVSTYHITPSTEWLPNGELKDQLINNYKKKLSAIDCKYFNRGEGTCPFGNSCFYAHVYRDGTREEHTLRKAIGDDESVRIVNAVRLSDFIDAFDHSRQVAYAN